MNPVCVRWMIRRDMDEVTAIDAAVFDFPWIEEDFVRQLRERTVIGMIADDGQDVAGFMLYELHKTRLHLLRMAVDPRRQRQGVGRTMIAKMQSKLSPDRRLRISTNVREGNLAGQLFFRSCGFKAVAVVRSHFGDSGEDAFVFRYCVRDAIWAKPENWKFA